MGLAELEIARVDWTSFVTATGPATGIGDALRALLGAADAEQASEAYWRLENHVVVQGELFGAAEPCAAVLVAALADPRPRHVRIAALELLFQVVTGAPSGGGDLAERCKARAREGLWLLIREAVSGEREAALDVLRELDADERIGAIERWASQ